MGIEVGIAAAGLAIAGAGTAVSMRGARQAEAAQEQAIAAQRRQEELRQRQLNLDAMRRQREIMREAIRQRAYSLAATTASGAGQGSSAMGGATGQISGQQTVNQLGVSQNQEIGNSMFSANRDLLTAYRAQAAAQTTQTTGAGLSSLGGQIMTNAGAIARVGQTVFNGISSWYRPTPVASSTGWTKTYG